MERILVYKNKISKTYYDTGSKVIYYEYAGILDRKATEIQINKVLEFVTDKKVYGILLDIRKLMGSFSKLLPFLRKIYYPTLIKRGLICKTIVVSDDIIMNHLSRELYDLLIEFGIKASIFHTIEEAEKWLDEMIINRSKSDK